jgi:hypothetical protein
MLTVLISLVIGLFVAMLFLNVYFRIKVFKVYKVLVQNRVEFGSKHIFNSSLMEKEVVPKFPKQADDIRLFSRHIKYSINMAVVLIALITLFGAILMYFRHQV